jgi:hypothetical protein
MFGLVTTQETLTHWRDGSRTAALLTKRDELVITLQLDTHELPSVQAEIDVAVSAETSVRASALIGDADTQAVKKAEKVTAAARERCARLEQSIATTRAAIGHIDAQLPDAERADRERHAREVIAPRFEKLVKRLAAKMSSAGEDMLELEIFSREIREQYPSDYMVPDGFKPVGVYLDAAAPRVMTDMYWQDMALPERGSERATKLSTWLKAWRDAGYDI